MRKILISFLSVWILAFSFAAPVMAADTDTDGTEMVYVVDKADLLGYDEWEQLEQYAAEISQRTGCGVYVVTLDDYQEYADGDIQEVVEKIYRNEENNFGIGSEKNGIMLLMSVSGGDYALFVYGAQAEQMFDGNRLDTLNTAFPEDLGERDWYAGFQGYLDRCNAYLAEPVRKSPVPRILCSIGVSLLVALIVCMFQKSKMKTVHKKVEAAAYVTGAVVLTEHYDKFTHTAETRRRIESSSQNAGGGTDGGNVRSGKI